MGSVLLLFLETPMPAGNIVFIGLDAPQQDGICFAELKETA